MTIGLDISTSCTGLTILYNDGSLALIEAIRLNKIDNIYNKALAILNRLKELKIANNWQYSNIYIEQPLGYSNNAKTVVTLCQFNGLVSGMLFNEFGIQPKHFTINELRKAFLPEYVTAKGVLSIPKELDKKMVVFDKVDNLLKNQIDWEYNRNGKLQSWCLDATDSYCVAYGGMLNDGGC